MLLPRSLPRAESAMEDASSRLSSGSTNGSALAIALMIEIQTSSAPGAEITVSEKAAHVAAVSAMLAQLQAALCRTFVPKSEVGLGAMGREWGFGSPSPRLKNGDLRAAVTRKSSPMISHRSLRQQRGFFTACKLLQRHCGAAVEAWTSPRGVVALRQLDCSMPLLQRQ